MKKITLFIILLLSSFVAQSQKISANQGWSVAIPVGTITEAGNDYTTSTTSSTAQTLIDFKTGGKSRCCVQNQIKREKYTKNLTFAYGSKMDLKKPVYAA